MSFKSKYYGWLKIYVDQERRRWAFGYPPAQAGWEVLYAFSLVEIVDPTIIIAFLPAGCGLRAWLLTMF